jgi:site-specific recombinase XerD
MGASRPGGVVAFTRSNQTLGGAAAAFLAQPDLAASTRHSYQQTLDRLERALGSDQPSATLTTNQVTAAVTAAWDGCAPATWNRHVATIRSFTSYCRRHRWLTDDLTAGPGPPRRARRPHQGHPLDPTRAALAPRRHRGA